MYFIDLKHFYVKGEYKLFITTLTVVYHIDISLIFTLTLKFTLL